MDLNKLTLTGDENIPAMPVTTSEVNHLRRLLAWLRCEYMLDEHMQHGYISGLSESVQKGISSSDKAEQLLQEKANLINQVPAYVRQAHKMLTKAVERHDKNSGVVNEN